VAVVLVYLAHLVYLVYMAYMVYLANVCRPHLTSGIDEDAMQKAASCKFPAATRRLVALKGSTYAHILAATNPSEAKGLWLCQ